MGLWALIVVFFIGPGINYGNTISDSVILIGFRSGINDMFLAFWLVSFKILLQLMA